MAINNQALLAGLSNSTVPNVFNNLRSVGAGGYNIGSSNPASVIQNALDKQTVSTLTFPSDLPKYFFTILETDYKRIGSAARALVQGFDTTEASAFSGENAGSYQLNPEKRYRLPLPTPLTDTFEVEYDQNFNYLGAAIKAAGALSGTIGGAAARIGGLAESAIRAAGAASGITLNTFKTVTMEVPKYRTFQFSWKLAPKNFREAQDIQRIVYGLRKGMTPKRDPTGNKLLLQFPKIYVMYFSPNPKYLYKFKPAVLTSIAVDYSGGNPFPAFYRATGADQESPVESVVISTSWLELEYWLDSLEDPSLSDYKLDSTGLPTNDPFDSWNSYTMRTGSPDNPDDPSDK